jgi:hypothetical protein
MSTAMTHQFLTRSFSAGETIAVLLRRENPASTTQRIVRLEQALASRYLAWLRYENHNGANVYVGANPLHPGSRRRTKECITEVRHLYLDIDVDGEERIGALRASDAVPVPTAILSTSPGKYQVLWRVQGFDFDQQEDMLKVLAIAFGGDSACTDRNRVLRVPGFRNCKYDPAHLVTVEYPSDSIYRSEDFRLDNPARYSTFPIRRVVPTELNRKDTRSEQDWAWTVLQLSMGEDAGKITLMLASQRSDKPDPLYYAQRTIDIASARISLLQGASIEDVITIIERRRSADLPAADCFSRAREIATTAQRMFLRRQFV